VGGNNIARIKSSWRKRIIIRNYYETDFKKKALLVYIISPFREKNGFHHQNYLTAHCIADVLNVLEYKVDICDYGCNARIDYQQYNLVFGFGSCFDKSIVETNVRTKKIVFLTGAHFLFQNKMTMQMQQLFYEKYGCYCIEEARLANENGGVAGYFLADAAVQMGNEVNKGILSEYFRNPIYCIGNTVYDLPVRMLDFAPRNFIFVVGSGVVHKGLPMVLEYFKQRQDLKLTIFMHHISSTIRKLFNQHLFDLPNITTFVGKTMVSEEMHDAVKQSTFAINMSCSEAVCGSTIQLMSYGVIPIVTKYDNIDLESKGILIDGFDESNLDNAIKNAISLSDEDILIKRKKCQDYVKEKHNSVVFKRDLTQYIMDIMK